MLHGGADARIRGLAAEQHGTVTRAQLLGAGVSAGAIDHRLKKRTLEPVYRGVYRMGPVPAPYEREMAAVLACGPQAALSDATAGGIWEVMPSPPREAPVDVAGPRSLRGPASGVRLHRRKLEPDEVTVCHGLALTTPGRTILDLASNLGSEQLERILAQALDREIVTRDAIEALLRRHRGRRGCRLLRALIDADGSLSLTRSAAEAQLLTHLRRADVPRPRVNAMVCGLQVDFFWPDHGLVVEVDGFAYHCGRRAFENDRRRDGILAAEGFTVLRVTYRQIQKEPDKVMARLCMLLAAGRGSKRLSPGRRAYGGCPRRPDT